MSAKRSERQGHGKRSSRVVTAGTIVRVMSAKRSPRVMASERLQNGVFTTRKNPPSCRLARPCLYWSVTVILYGYL